LLYAIAALVLALAVHYCGVSFRRSNAVTNRLLFASIIYVPLSFVFMIIAES